VTRRFRTAISRQTLLLLLAIKVIVDVRCVRVVLSLRSRPVSHSAIFCAQQDEVVAILAGPVKRFRVNLITSAILIKGQGGIKVLRGVCEVL